MDLTNLSQKELKALVAKAEFLLEDSPQNPEQKDAPSLIYQELDKLLGGGAKALPPYPVAMRHKGFKKFSSSASALIAFVDDSFKPSRVERTKALRIVLEAFVHWLQEMSIPCTFSTIANNLEKAPVILEAAFPGYRASGLLHLLLKARRQAG